MGRFVHRFEDQSRPIGKHDAAGETVKFLGQLLLATLLVCFLAGLSWMMVTGDPRSLLRVLNTYL